MRAVTWDQVKVDGSSGSRQRNGRMFESAETLWMKLPKKPGLKPTPGFRGE
jgi:hypothetical protein